MTQARDKQWINLLDDSWDVHGIVAGRGFGKTMTGSNTTGIAGVTLPILLGEPLRIAVVAPTSGDLRRICFEGQSGLLNVIPPILMKGGSRDTAYNRSFGELTLFNDTCFFGYSAEEGDRLRGPEHHLAWCDEIAAWNKHEAQNTWDNLEMGLRLGEKPRVIFTSTPKPVPHFKELLKHPKGLVIVRGSTFENEANLPKSFIDRVKARYEGTRLGRQELYAEMLEDIEGALWRRDLFRHISILPEFKRKVVSVDPAITATEESDETGIIVAGRTVDDRGCLIKDLSGRYSPGDWAKRAIAAFREFECDVIVAEKNQGGDMVEHTLRTVDPTIPIKLVHASKGKRLRAEPVAALYEQGKVDHWRPPVDVYSRTPYNTLLEVEDQMCTWEPLEGNKSPDRLDAAVHGLTELMLTHHREFW